MEAPKSPCLDEVYAATGNDLALTMGTPGFSEIGSALFCDTSGCTRMCDTNSAEPTNRLYGVCQRVVAVDVEPVAADKAMTTEIATPLRSSADIAAARAADSARMHAAVSNYEPDLAHGAVGSDLLEDDELHLTADLLGGLGTISGRRYPK